MILTSKIEKAIRLSIETHEIYRKQKRKPRDIPYITHPITVGLILARAGADEDVICAGLLHDTIEDSVAEKKVTREMIKKKFGENVADLVLSVTEQNKELPWEERKKEALEHIKTFSHDSLLVKSADTLSNVSEILDDYEESGEKVFKNFNASKGKVIQNYTAVINTIVECWPNNPLLQDLQNKKSLLQRIV